MVNFVVQLGEQLVGEKPAPTVAGTPLTPDETDLVVPESKLVFTLIVAADP